MQGIEVKMITGDHLLIGKETAKMLGMGVEMYPSETLIKVRLAAWGRGGWVAQQVQDRPGQRYVLSVSITTHSILGLSYFLATD